MTQPHTVLSVGKLYLQAQKAIDDGNVVEIFRFGALMREYRNDPTFLAAEKELVEKLKALTKDKDNG